MIARLLGFFTSKLRLILIVAALSAAGVAAWWMYQQGKLACQSEMQAAVDKERAAQRRLVDALREAQNERESRTRTATRTIYREADPTGCADSDALPGVLDALRPDGSGPAPD